MLLATGVVPWDWQATSGDHALIARVLEPELPDHADSAFLQFWRVPLR